MRTSTSSASVLVDGKDKPFDEESALVSTTSLNGKSHTSQEPPSSAITNLWQWEEELDFVDGNVIIVAEKSLFRVHIGTVYRHSDIFLHLARPWHVPRINGEEVPASCHVVRVSDSAHDMRHLLKIMYDGYDYLQRSQGFTEFKDHAAAARLAYKYNISAVLDRATTALQPLLPKSFDVWFDEEEMRASGTTFHSHNAIEAVVLFRALGWNDMLPAALYLCCLLDTDDLLFGRHRADGTLEKLSREDMRLCLDMQKTCLRQSASMTRELYTCERSAGCVNNRLFVANVCKVTLREAQQRESGAAMSADPLGGHLRDQIDGLLGEGKICAECARMLETREKELRRKLWVSLPELMGVSVVA